ncbi:DUF3021 family protein [Anaerocolumna sp. MB42-C2]|uniref:DUF3021 family protein n=1 Tax=Anaerocolumna sp. MB42-C2 TaxID=3070997 RepID=UPI0027DF91F6|nr:DUF3021 family protein [Anaerocolumna sp. MB42-C2]WMJ89314.1 DUF3021 family protein [Anaerocolumna sp. MB42-C2]
MYKKILLNFLFGLVISYTIEILVMAVAVILSGLDSIPVFMIIEAFGLAACCSFIGAVFSSNRLNYYLQVVLTYIFTFIVIISFSLMFRWYDNGQGIFGGKSFFIIIISLFTTGYIIILLIKGVIQRKRVKLMNTKLAEYKENKEKEKGGE